MTRQESRPATPRTACGAIARKFLAGREAIVQFLARKWARELDYRLIKELWAFYEKRIAVRFAYEWRDDSGHWFRSYGNENWEFDGNGLMARRIASIGGLSAAVRTVIPVSPIWACSSNVASLSLR